MNNKNLIVAKGVSAIIVESFGTIIDKIILFGSRAREDFKEDSDFDFLVLGKFDLPVLQRGAVIRKNVKDFGYPVDYVPLTTEEFETNFLLKNTVLQEGVVLYAKPSASLD